MCFYEPCPPTPPKAVQNYLDSRENTDVPFPALNKRSISKPLIWATSSCSRANLSAVMFCLQPKRAHHCVWEINDATAPWNGNSVRLGAHVTLKAHMCTQLLKLHLRLFPLTLVQKRKLYLVYHVLFIFKPLKMLETAKTVTLSMRLK